MIGKGSVIGSNVFITSSVRPGTRMSVKTQELVIRHKDDLEDLGEEKLSKTENDSSGKTIKNDYGIPQLRDNFIIEGINCEPLADARSAFRRRSVSRMAAS